MKILKQLSKYFLIFITYCFPINSAISNEPVDIWNIEKSENVIEKKTVNNDKKDNKDETFRSIEISEQNKNIIVNSSLDTNNIKLAGLYDPSENGLSIDMWSYSNGNEIKKILEDLN